MGNILTGSISGLVPMLKVIDLSEPQSTPVLLVDFLVSFLDTVLHRVGHIEAMARVVRMVALHSQEDKPIQGGSLEPLPLF